MLERRVQFLESHGKMVQFCESCFFFKKVQLFESFVKRSFNSLIFVSHISREKINSLSYNPEKFPWVMFDSYGFPRSIDHFLSLGDCMKLVVSTVRVSRDTKTNWVIDISVSHRFPCCIEHNKQRRLTDWHAFRTAVIGVFSVCFGEQLAERGVVYVQVRWRCNVGEGTLGVDELVEDHVVGLITCVVGVVSPLRGVAQVVLHCARVAEVGVRLRVHQDRGVEEDGEDQVEVEREEGEVKERRSWLACGWNEDSRTSWAMRCMWHQGVTAKERDLRAVLTGAACACRGSCTCTCWCSLCHDCCPHRSCKCCCCIRTVFVAIDVIFTKKGSLFFESKNVK